MELITSLILLVVLVAPPLFLAGRELLGILFSGATDGLAGQHSAVQDTPESEGWEMAPIYDGMITVEIPARKDEVIAYEPLPDDEEIALLDCPSRATGA